MACPVGPFRMVFTDNVAIGDKEVDAVQPVGEWAASRASTAALLYAPARGRIRTHTRGIA